MSDTRQHTAEADFPELTVQGKRAGDSVEPGLHDCSGQWHSAFREIEAA